LKYSLIAFAMVFAGSIGLASLDPSGNLRGSDAPTDARQTLTTRGDAQRGKILFEKRCTGCHAMDGEREGPRLAGVFGRKAGSVPGFPYSKGLINYGLTWNEVTLDRWLTDPDLIAPDTMMDFQVPKAQERADLIAYLRR
jgi:cytochrome c2